MRQTSTQAPLFAEERQARILELLEENEKITVPELSDIFEVSTVTIRSDLRSLESEGKLKRTHGGAIPIGKAAFEPTSSIKEVEHPREKQAIAERALECIEDGDTIALDTGTTTYELAKLLSKRSNLTVITNDLKIALCLESTSEAALIFIGGIIRRGFHCTTGPTAIGTLSDLNVDKVFLAANAFTSEKGFTTPSLQQAELKKALIRAASETIMLTDSSKFGQVSFVRFAGLDDIQKLITDKNLSAAQKKQLEVETDHMEIVYV